MRLSAFPAPALHRLVAAWLLAAAGPLMAAGDPPVPPRAETRPFEVVSPHGTRVDEYHWLRDDTRRSPEVLAYLDAENAYRDAVMAPQAALRQALRAELAARLAPADDSVPVFEHGHWTYTRHAPGSEFPLYARRKGSMKAREQVMLDGPAEATGKSYFQVGHTALSPDGRWLAWTVDETGRRQYTLKVRDLASGRDLPDRIGGIAEKVLWAGDSRTLLMLEKDPVTLQALRVRTHRLGEPATASRLVYEEKDPAFNLSLRQSRSQRFLFIRANSTQQNEWWYADARDPQLRWRPVRPREADLTYEVEHLGSDFVLRTDWRAPNGRIVRVPIAHSADKARWRDVLAHRADASIDDFEVARGHLAVLERSGGLRRLRVQAWRGGPARLVDADDPTYTMRLVATPGVESTTLRYVYSSLTTPPSTIDLDVGTWRRTVRKVEAVLGGFDAANYRSAFLRAPARDGTLVPVSLVWRVGTPRDGSAPLLQLGYGAYGLSSDPGFRSHWLSLLDRGFVVAIAHVRGGQELGRAWYEKGRLEHKVNTFTDFIDVTRHLVAERWVARDKVFAEGRSAGGLLVGAVANMAPQDYRGIIAGVPFVDVVTTMLDESIPLTTGEFDEWGNPKIKRFHDLMLSYSPYDNVRAQDYPAMLVTTGLWDSQVQYYEPAKWVARLRAKKTNAHPLVFSVDMSAGHGGRAGRFQRLDDAALQFAFMLKVLGLER